MQQNVQTGLDVLTKGIEELGQGVYVITPFKRKFNFFAYMGFGIENFYEFDTALTNKAAAGFETKVNTAAIQELQFRPLGELEGTMSEDGQHVFWYEQGVFNARSEITTDASGTDIVVTDIERYAVNQLVTTAPVGASVGTESTVKVVAVDVNTSTVTVDSAVVVKQGDQLLVTQQLQTVGSATTGSFTGLKSDKLKSVFGKFGAEVEFQLSEILTTRFFTKPDTYIKNKVGLAAIKLYNDLASSFFKGLNIAGDQPVPEGLDHVIAEREADGLVSKFTLAGADEKAKLADLSDKLDLAFQSPVYKDGEPLLIMNQLFKSKMAKSMRDADVVLTNNDGVAHVNYGLKTISSPYLSDTEGVIVEQMNQLYFKPTAFIIPKHLITFKQPAMSLVAGADGQLNAITNSPGKILMFAEPQVTGDKVSNHLEYYCANLFAGITYENSYMRLAWN